MHDSDLPDQHSVLSYCPEMPSFMLSNVYHILNKMDEIHLFSQKNHHGILAITGTFLDCNTQDSVIELADYVVFR